MVQLNLAKIHQIKRIICHFIHLSIGKWSIITSKKLNIRKNRKDSSRIKDRPIIKDGIITQLKWLNKREIRYNWQKIKYKIILE